MSGLESFKSTTTFKVIEVDMTKEQYEEIILKSLQISYGNILTDINEFAMEDAKELLTLANVFPIGSILEKRGNKFIRRT